MLGLCAIASVKRDLTIYKILVTFGEVAIFLSQINFNFLQKDIFSLYEKINIVLLKNLQFERKK